MTIKAVLFDMDGTLTKTDVVHPEEVFQRILISLGISRSLDEVKMAFSNAYKEAEGINLLASFGKTKREEHWHRWDSLVLKQLGIAENVELAKIIQSKWFDFVNFTLHPESKKVLRELRKKRVNVGAHKHSL